MGLPRRTLAVLLLSLPALGAGPALAEPILALDLNGQGPEVTVGPGAQVGVAVFASGIPLGSDGLGLFGFGFSLLYDTDLVVTNLVLDPLWVGTGFDDIRNEPGDAGLISNLFFESAGPSGDGILLGTVYFATPTPSTTTAYSLELSYFTAEGDNVLFDGTSLDSQAGFFGVGGTIIVTPEPTTALLILAGLGGFAAQRRVRANTPSGARRS
jgi:hypothetical protein